MLSFRHTGSIPFSTYCFQTHHRVCPPNPPEDLSFCAGKIAQRYCRYFAYKRVESMYFMVILAVIPEQLSQDFQMWLKNPNEKNLRPYMKNNPYYVFIYRACYIYICSIFCPTNKSLSVLQLCTGFL